MTSEEFELYVRVPERCVIFSFHTEGGLFAVFVGAPIAEFDAFRHDIEKTFMHALDLAPDLAARVRAGRREERFYGSSDLPNFYRKPYGNGWALVGDAGLHKDPFLALGICDGLRDVDLLADAIRDGLGGGRPLNAALSEFEEKRNAASSADYHENIAAASFAPYPPHFLAARAILRDKPDETTRFFKMRNRMVASAESV